jgi:hypothetical protein
MLLFQKEETEEGGGQEKKKSGWVGASLAGESLILKVQV